MAATAHALVLLAYFLPIIQDRVIYYIPVYFCSAEGGKKAILRCVLEILLLDEVTKKRYLENLVCVGNTLVGRGDRKKVLGKLGVRRKCLKEATSHLALSVLCTGNEL